MEDSVDGASLVRVIVHAVPLAGFHNSMMVLSAAQGRMEAV